MEELTEMPLGSINAIVWFSAAAALLLLVAVGVVAGIVSSRSRDVVARVLKVGFLVLVPVLAVFPGLVVTAGTSFLLHVGLLFYVVFFSCFCYYLGKSIGLRHGKREIRDLVGLNSAEGIEDVQDRLLESRMRYPTRAAVVDSIGKMARAGEEERLEGERQLVAPRPPAPPIENEKVDREAP